MAVSSAANSETFKVTTPSDLEIELTRLFDAPRDLVFAAMTTPEHVKQWWGRLNDGYSVPVCEVDLRVGGTWRFVNRIPSGKLVAFNGVYREIARPDRLVYTEDLRRVPRYGIPRNHGLHRRGGQDAPDSNGALSLDRGSRPRPQDRHGEGRGDELRPAGRCRGGAQGAGLSAAPKRHALPRRLPDDTASLYALRVRVDTAYDIRRSSAVCVSCLC